MEKFWVSTCVFLLTNFAIVSAPEASELYRKPDSAVSRWSTFENPNGVKGKGGMENRGAKGRAFVRLESGESRVLLDVEGSGVITRMWFTVNEDRSSEMLRALKLEFFWDGAKTPAVAAPFGDFFAAGLDKPIAFESALISNPEGRSFNSFIPMPFRKGAKIVITNESEERLRLIFYDVDFLLDVEHPDDMMYFHAHWRRENPTTLGEDFAILPRVSGSGRYLGTNISIITRPENVGWWGEGEVKMYIDGDKDLPTIVGTGTEDYIGTAYGTGTYSNQYQGCLIADDAKGHYSFYRYHVPDPVYFDKDIRVTIQQMGGIDSKSAVINMLNAGVPIIPVSIGTHDQHINLFDLATPVDIATHDSPENAWVNFYRRDDVSAVAYFYLDRPENGLPPLADVDERTRGMRCGAFSCR